VTTYKRKSGCRMLYGFRFGGQTYLRDFGRKIPAWR
jgi:hypothetical protein